MQYVYLLRCADGTYYTGWTNDLTRRLAAHNSGRGAKYTRGRGPVTLAFSEVFADKGEALGYEAALKKLSREQKLGLIASQNTPDAEYLEIYDADGRPCVARPRAVVHRQGLRHAVVHLWALETRAGVPGFWLQRRALDRPLFPGKYDLAATGHIGAGEAPETAILREASEECGLTLAPGDAVPALEVFSQRYDRSDGGFDDELAHIFRYDCPPGTVFRPGPEVIGMHWVRAADFARVMDGTADTLPLDDGTVIGADALSCRHAGEWAYIKTALHI